MIKKPSRAERIANQKRLDAIMIRLERPFIRSIGRLRNEAVNMVIDAYKKNKPISSNEIASMYNQKMAVMYGNYAEQIIDVFGTDTLRQLPKFAPMFLEKKAVNERFFQTIKGIWLAEYGLEQITKTSNTLLGDIYQAISGSNQGDTLEQTITKLGSVRSLTSFRAMTIGRTETHNMAMFASHQTAYQIEVEAETKLLKFWSPTEDERTRISHMEMADSEGVALDADFVLNSETGGVDYMQRPGDPSGSAGNVINCRCVLTYGEQE